MTAGIDWSLIEARRHAIMGDPRHEPEFEQRRYYPVERQRLGNRKQRRAAIAKDRKQ